VRIRSTHIYRDTPPIIRLGVGPSLAYQVEFFDRPRRAPLAGVQVEFQRTGGVQTTAERFTAVSRADGRISFPIRPLAAGTLQGRLIFRAPIPSTPETLLVALPTFDDDGGRFFGVVAAGAYLPYFGIVSVGPVGLAGVKVDVKRVGGIQVSPADYTIETRAGGIFPLDPIPLALGEVIVDLTIRPPAPYASFSVRGVRLATADRTVSDRLIGVYPVDAPRSASSDGLVNPP